MITADDYRTVARVLEFHMGDPEQVSFYREQAAKVETVRAYGIELAMIGHIESAESRGLKILAKLKEDGWTPPEGLF